MKISIARHVQKLCASVTVGVIAMTIGSVQAAERVELGFGPIEIGVSVKELETYAKQGRVGKELELFLSLIGEIDSPAATAEASTTHNMQKFLTLRADFSALQVSQFLHSAVGEKILAYLGDLVQIDRNLNGAKAMRAGLISAAADSDGLSLINFLRKYPTRKIRLNLKKGFEVANKIDKLTKETGSVVSGVEKLSAELAKTEPKIKPRMMANLADPGQYTFKLQTEILNDVKRNRRFPVDFYLPQEISQPAPVILLSHGLASDRQHFAAIAKHLASHGFVAVTGHWSLKE